MENIEKKSITILFTCVGRRVELIQAFKTAGFDENVDLTIIGVDYSLNAPALYYCDKHFEICRIDDELYIPSLLKLCEEHHVDMVIPTIDTDLLKLADARSAFLNHGIDVLISDLDKIKICRDKRITAEFFKDAAVATPVVFEDAAQYEGPFPCFIKPKDGSASTDAYKANSQEELLRKAKIVKDYIVQPFIEGIEYTVDVLCALDEAPIFIVPRRRVSVRSGEVLVTTIEYDQQIIDDAHKIVKAFKPRGPITIQLIKDAEGTRHFIEINPRFGGGVPLTIKSGVPIPNALLRIFINKEVAARKQGFRNLTLSRFDQSIAIGRIEDIPTFSNYSELLPIIKTLNVSGIVFDLDDTLYLERDYVRSGFDALCQSIIEFEGEEDTLWQSFLQGSKKSIDDSLEKRNLYSIDLKNKALDCYRNHVPTIQLLDGAGSFLETWKALNLDNRLGLITDGRPNGQRNKIEALEISHLFDEIIVTDELAGNSGNIMRFRKPNAIAFQIMRERLGIDYSKLVYIGDNPLKDFQAPLALGMKCIRYIPKNGIWA